MRTTLPSSGANSSSWRVSVLYRRIGGYGSRTVRRSERASHARVGDGRVALVRTRATRHAHECWGLLRRANPVGESAKRPAVLLSELDPIHEAFDRRRASVPVQRLLERKRRLAPVDGGRDRDVHRTTRLVP